MPVARETSTAYAALALAWAFNLVPGTTMAAESRLFAIVETAVASRAQGPAELGRLLGTAFQSAPERSSKYFQVLRSGPSTLHKEVKAAEIRVPAPGAAATGGLIEITVDPKVQCTPREAILKKYGDSPELIVPTPRQPASSPLFYVYRFPWGELRFGAAQSGPECVETVVIDYKS